MEWTASTDSSCEIDSAKTDRNENNHNPDDYAIIYRVEYNLPSLRNCSYSVNAENKAKYLACSDICRAVIEDFKDKTDCGRIPGLVDNRIRYHRNIKEIARNSVASVYEINPLFTSSAYEAQYFHYKLDSSKKVIKNSKEGMCPFCKEIKFLNFKTSRYASHLSLFHGIYSNGYIVPEPLNFGYYYFKKNRATSGFQRRSIHHTRLVLGCICPACGEIIEVAIWNRNNSTPLLHYLRHFRDTHYFGSKEEYVSNICGNEPGLMAMSPNIGEGIDSMNKDNLRILNIIDEVSKIKLEKIRSVLDYAE